MRPDQFDWPQWGMHQHLNGQLAGRLNRQLAARLGLPLNRQLDWQLHLALHAALLNQPEQPWPAPA